VSLPDLAPLVRFDERLREVPIDPRAVEAALREASRALDAADEPNERLKPADLRGHRRTHPRPGRRVDCPPPQGARAGRRRARRRGQDPARRGVPLRRPARRRRPGAREALTDARQSGAHLDFALQHLGKALLDTGKPEGAVAVLEEAWALRRDGGDAELIRSTELALALARGRQGT